MEKSLIIAGFGGQGVMVIGQLLAYTAFETTDKKVTYFLRTAQSSAAVPPIAL